jgi:TolB-like protein/Tfp pilus assembly protein PilF
MEAIKKQTHEEIFTELESVLKFNSLKNSPILSRFLRYIVEETLNEHQHFIKEYSIAINVLNRSADFNSNDDAVVRIHAGRLRRILNEYYLTEGQNNSLLINIPIGGYIPSFIRKESIRPIVPPHDNTNPIIAIFPFKSITTKQNLDIFSLMLCEELSAELSLFEDISVIGHFSPELTSKINQNVLEAAKMLHADFIITGNLQCNDKELQIRINLLNSTTGEFVMTKSFDHIEIKDILKIQNEIVHTIVCEIGGYYGSIFKEIIKNSPSRISNNLSIWKGVHSYYKYQCECSFENYWTAFRDLDEATKLHPNHAVTWAMLGEFYLNGVAFGIDCDENSIEEAYRCVMKALKIDPHCQHAWHTLTWVNLFKKAPEDCIYPAEQCIKINPNASGIISGVGCMLVFAGYFDKGFHIMEDAIQKNPYCPWWINVGYCYYYLAKKEYKNAFYWAEKMDTEETFWEPLLKCATLFLIGEESKAQKYFAKLLHTEPKATKVKETLSSLILSEDLVLEIVRVLERIELNYNMSISNI